MFKPVEMVEASLYVLNKDLKEVTDLLYDLKLIEFMKVEHEKFGKHEKENVDAETHRLLELRSMISLLKPHFTKNIGSNPKDALTKAREFLQTRDQTRKDIYKLEDQLRKLKVVKGLKLTEQDLKKKKFFVGAISASEKKLLTKFKKVSSFKVFELGERIYFATKLDKKKLPFPYTTISLPSTSSSEVITKKIDAKNKKIDMITKKLEDLADASLVDLEAEEARLTRKLSIHEAQDDFIKTKNLSVLSGHVPKNKVLLLKRKLEYTLGNKFHLATKKAGKDAPTHLENGKLGGSFESLLELYSLPSYREFDPTKLMLLVFPFFFGFVLGDAVYGLISLIVFTLAKSYMPKLKDFMTVLQLSAISTIIWGVIYGEFIGFKSYGPFWGFFQRAYDPQLLLMFALAFGFIHINMGVLIGAWNNRHNMKHAICDHISWLVLQLGVIGIALGALGFSVIFTYVGWAVFVLALILLYLGHGFIGIIEIPSFFTNIFSYARLMAVGLSSIAIAILINQFSVPLFQSGPVGIIFGIIVFSLGHIFNTILGNFESFLHTLRLHYVEFFTKFYQGDGKKFVPFGERNSQEQ